MSAFVDVLNREFSVQYDALGRVTSILATRGRNIADVERVAYYPSGRLAGFSLAAGYDVAVNYGDDGAQLFRDRFGGMMIRRFRDGRWTDLTAEADPTGRLQATMTRLEDLFAAIGSSLTTLAR